MNVSPESLLAIGTVVTLLVQAVKRLMPGDWDDWGLAFTMGMTSIVVAAWVAQNGPDDLRSHAFEIVTLWATVLGMATGIYKGARMVTATPDDTVPLPIIRGRKPQVRSLHDDEQEAA